MRLHICACLALLQRRLSTVNSQALGLHLCGLIISDLHVSAPALVLPQCAAAVDNLAGYFFKHMPTSEAPTPAAAVRPARGRLSQVDNAF
jgi:hypothetical protein